MAALSYIYFLTTPPIRKKKSPYIKNGWLYYFMKAPPPSPPPPTSPPPPPLAPSLCKNLHIIVTRGGEEKRQEGWVCLCVSMTVCSLFHLLVSPPPPPHLFHQNPPEPTSSFSCCHCHFPFSALQTLISVRINNPTWPPRCSEPHQKDLVCVILRVYVPVCTSLCVCLCWGGILWEKDKKKKKRRGWGIGSKKKKKNLPQPCPDLHQIVLLKN